MKTIFASITLLLLCCAACYAQSPFSIKGAAVDTAEKKQLPNATIMVLNAKDSVLNKFTRAANDGSFAINNLGKGKFILILSYPGYADYTEGFTLDEKTQSHDFGKLSMTLKERLLHEVIIKGQVTAIKIKGDTTEFNAKAYVIQPNDRVEDLIKQFPGIQVDKDGKITAQGQEVKKVLVDGEEFFGDDPTLVTKNLRADMVDKVQLYDKKSDQAAFTGIDDGQKTKTLNIKLKDNKKNGYFGKIDAGIGTDGYYQGQGMYNKFTAKQKFSAYGISSNTGKTGLGWQDSQKYGDSGGVTIDDNGGISVFFSGSSDGLDSFNGRYDGQGIPKATTGGLHYDTKWDKDNQTLNANYKIGQLDINGTRNTLTQNNLPGGVINTNADQNFKNSMFRQKADFTYLFKLDTTATLKIAVDGTYKEGKANNNYLTVSRRSNDALLNRNSRNIINDDITHQFNASALYTKKLKKKGRTISLLFSEAVNNVDSKGFLKSETDYYNTVGALDSMRFIDQYKTNALKNTVFNSNITYTEPLFKGASVIINYGLNINDGSADTRSYNKSVSGIYNILDPTLSNYYKLNQVSNQVGAILNYKQAKTTLNFGLKASSVDFKQTNEYTGNIYKRNFINWNPQATYQYRFSQQDGLYLSYNGNNTQPTINQIQPVKVNTDPLNIILGNQDLGPAFTNRFNLSYNSYKVLSGRSLFIGGSYSFTSSQIINNTITDASSGKSTTQYINLVGKTPYNYNLYADYSVKIQPLDFNIGLDLSTNGNKNFAYTNSVLNSSNTNSYSAQIGINKYIKNKFDFYVNFGPNYNISKSSLQTQVNNNGGGFNANGSFNVYLPAKFQLSSDVSYTYTAKTATFNDDFKRTILNATLSKAFFKEKSLKLSVSGNDLLNQNVGFRRSATANLITQNSYTTIQRYFMLSVTWDFSKMGGEPAKK